MLERPILFQPAMVRAILAGQKSQTRRRLKEEVPPPPAMDNIIHATNAGGKLHPAPYLDAYCGEPRTRENPRGMGPRWCWWTRDNRPCRTFKVGYRPGMRLWVRETWKPHSSFAHMKPSEIPPSRVFYAADNGYSPSNTSWRQGIHMPRWASRLLLTVTDVRVQRLQDITEDDARAEGVGPADEAADWDFHEEAKGSHRASFAALWNRIHGREAWDANPYVVALSFTPTITDNAHDRHLAAARA